MSFYENVFTQTQVMPTHPETGEGVGDARLARERYGKPILSYWLGFIGNAQIGPSTSEASGSLR